VDVDQPAYDIFISYSRKDTSFVELLVKALKNFTPPKALDLPARRLKVFMDTEDLYGSEYYSAIDHALKSASKLGIVCSPHARASVYIADEIKRFVRNEKRSPADVVPMLYAGLANNEGRQPEDEALKAFPDVLYEIMKMPLAVDFRGFDAKRNRIDSGAYRNAWFTLLATVLNVNRDELEEREHKRQRRRRMFIGSVVAAVICSLSVLSAVALWQRDAAIDQRRRAYARQLAAQAQVELTRTTAPAEEPVRRALASLQLDKTDAADNALQTGVARLPPRFVTRLALNADDDLPRALRFTPDGRRLLGASRNGVLLWDTNNGAPLLSHPVNSTPTIHGITADSRHALLSVPQAEKASGPSDLLLINMVTLEVRKASFDRLFDAAVTAEGPLALTADPEGKRLRAYDPIRGEAIGERVVKRPIALAGLHPSQDRMALVDADGHVSVSNRRLDKVHGSFTLPTGAKPNAFGWQAGVLAVTLANGSIEIRDLQRGAVSGQLPKSEVRSFLGFTGGDRFLSIAGTDGHPHLFSIGGSRVVVLEHGRTKDWDLEAMGDVSRQTPIIDVGASNDGAVLVTARKDGWIGVWQPTLESKYGTWGAVSMPSLRSIARFDHGDDLGPNMTWISLPALTVSPNGGYLASQSMGLKSTPLSAVSSYHPMIRIWDVKRGAEVARFYPCGGMVLAFAPAGDLLVTISPPQPGDIAKARLNLWQLSSAEEAIVERTPPALPSYIEEISVFSLDKRKPLGNITVTRPTIPPIALETAPMEIAVDSRGHWLAVQRTVQDHASGTLGYKFQFAVIRINDGATLFETPAREWTWNPMDIGQVWMPSAAFSPGGLQLVVEQAQRIPVDCPASSKMAVPSFMMPFPMSACSEPRSILGTWNVKTGRRTAQAEVRGIEGPGPGRRLAAIDGVTAQRTSIGALDEDKRPRLVTERVVIKDSPLIADACARLPENNRTLSQVRWERELPGQPYQPTCGVSRQ